VSPRQLLVEERLKSSTNTAHLIDDLPCPIKIVAPAIEGPIKRRCPHKVSKVTDQISPLHHFRFGTDRSGVLDLSHFSLMLRQRLIVRNLQHDAGDFLPECRFELIECHLGVLNRVMQNRCGQQRGIGHPRLVSKNIHEGNRMVNIG
jgi:hypothetical protein